MKKSAKYFTIKQVAERLGVSEATVRSWTKKPRKINFHLFGGSYRFSDADIESFENKNHFRAKQERAT